jgi:hypothetical protein
MTDKKVRVHLLDEWLSRDCFGTLYIGTLELLFQGSDSVPELSLKKNITPDLGVFFAEDEEWEEEEGLPLIIGKVNMDDEELKSWDEKFVEVTGASEHQAAIAHYGAENEDSYNQIRIISGEISGEIIKILKDEMEGDEYFYL